MDVERIDLITERLQRELSAEHINIIDQSHLHKNHPGAAGGGGHFILEITASKFQGRSSIERHKMIYQALGDAMGREIHAISIKATTPAEAATNSNST